MDLILLVHLKVLGSGQGVGTGWGQGLGELEGLGSTIVFKHGFDIISTPLGFGVGTGGGDRVGTRVRGIRGVRVDDCVQTWI